MNIGNRKTYVQNFLYADKNAKFVRRAEKGKKEKNVDV